MNLIWILTVVLLMLTLPSRAQIPARNSHPTPQIVQRLNEAEQTTLKGNTPPLALAQFDRGAVPDSTAAPRMLLVLKRSPAQETDLKQLIEDQQNPASPNFHKWLSTEDFGNRFGPVDSDLAQVTAWLQSKGFTVNKVGRGKQTLEFSGTTGQVKAAFNTELHTYEKDGVVFHANSSDPQVPTAFAPVIAGIASLNDIKPQPYSHVMGTALMDPRTHAALPQWNSDLPCSSVVAGVPTTVACAYYPPTPGDLAVQYNVNPVYKSGITGKGVTIGIVSDSNIDLGVVQNYRTLFGFANTSNLPLIIVDGDDPGQNADSLEAYLDVEASSAMAPDANVYMYTSADTLTTSGLINAIVRGVDDNTADILSVSYGACEVQIGAAGNQFFYQAWEQAAAQGQSVFVSAGDSGSAGCDNFNAVGQASLGLAVNGFGSTPFNTAVGGTDFYYSQWKEGKAGADLLAQVQAAWIPTLPTTNPTNTLQAPIQEQVWNVGYGSNVRNSQLGNSIVAGSGGASSCALGTGVDPNTGAYVTCTGGYPKPSWQVGAGVPADGVRDLPDVSLFASGGSNLSFWPICAGIYDCRADTTNIGYSVPVTSVGGTSAASPAMAGIMALVSQSQKTRLGNANYNLYALAAQYPNSFNDVTLGSNNAPCVKGTPNCSLDANGDGYYTLQQYSAGVGYDLASGLGSVNVANLVNNWSKVAYKSTVTTLTASSSTFAHGTPVTLTAGVTGPGGTPTGSVAVTTTNASPGQAAVGTIELKNGTGSSSTISLPGGTYTVGGSYSGDGVFAASSSTPATITVTPETSTSTLVATDDNTNVFPNTFTKIANGATFAYDDTLILDVTVAGKSGQGIPTGVVTFLDGTTSIGTATINASGIAELFTAAPGIGLHTITASYAGDGSFQPSATGSIGLNVTQGVPTVNITLPTTTVAGKSTVFTGQPVTIRITTYGGLTTVSPTGTVTLNFDNLPPQTVKLAPSYAALYTGVAYVTVIPATPGTFPVNVTYSGDANYTSATVQYRTAIVVAAPTLAPTTTAITSSTVSVGPDGIFTLSGTVTGSIAGKVPTGTMRYIFGAIAYVATLDANGHTSVLLSGQSLSSGVNNIVAVYPGNTVYAGSTSNTVPITANLGDFTLTASSQQIAVTSGATGTANLYIAQMVNGTSSGLTGAVNLTCTPASSAITCSVATPALNLLPNGAQASTTLTINSHVVHAENLPMDPFHRGKQMLGGGGLALATMLIFIPWSRRKRLPLLAMAVLFCIGTGLVGCGGKGSPTLAPVLPTGNATPGAYQVTIVGSIGGVQHALNLQVIVQ